MQTSLRPKWNCKFSESTRMAPRASCRPVSRLPVPRVLHCRQRAFDIELDSAGSSDSQALDWDAVEPRISPDVTGAGNWPAVYAQLQQTFGTTWGQYIAVLDRYATLLPASVGDPSNPTDVLGLAVNQAVAAVAPRSAASPWGPLPGSSWPATPSRPPTPPPATFLHEHFE